MSAALEAREPSARYLVAAHPPLVERFELVSDSLAGVGHLRELVVALALQGRLTQQNASDEPAEALLHRIQDFKATILTSTKRRSDLKVELGVVEATTLPTGWSWTTLATIGLINPRNDARDNVIASFVQMSSIPTALSDVHSAEPRRWKDIKSGFTQFAEGDVGVAKITPCFENGKSTVFRNLDSGIGAGTTELHIVRPLCGIEPRYVLLFLKSPGFLRGGEAVMTGTAGQKRLPRSYFENCPFPLPPLAEQTRIVARVDELMRLCDALEAKGRLEAEQHARLLGTLLGTLTGSTTPEELAANWQRVAAHFDLLLDRLEAVDSLERAILQLAVSGLLLPMRTNSWRHIRLAELMPEFQNGASSRGDPGGKAVTVLRLADIEARRISLANTRQVPIVQSAISKYQLLNGDILITRVNGSADIVGQFNLVEDDLDAIYCDHFIRMRINKKLLLPAYCALLGESEVIRKQVRNLFVSTAGQKTVNQGHIGSLKFALPPLEEQARIVARVTELRRLCADLRQRLAAQQAVQSHLADALVEQALA